MRDSIVTYGCRVAWRGKTEAVVVAGIIHFTDGDWYDPEGRIGHHKRSGALSVSGSCKIRGADNELRDFPRGYDEPQPLGTSSGRDQEETKNGIFGRFTG